MPISLENPRIEAAGGVSLSARRDHSISFILAKRHLTLSVLAGSCGGLLFGYDIGAMACAAPGIRSAFALSPAGLGLAVSVALMGTIAGSMLGGTLSDRLGRRGTLTLSGILYAFAIIAAAFATGGMQFTVSRVFCGIAIGLVSVTAPMYLAEVSPPAVRGRIAGSFQLSLSIGAVCAFGVGYLASGGDHASVTWRYILCGGIFPASLCVLCLFWALPSELAPRASSEQARLFTRQYLKPIALAVGLALFNQLTGVNALLYYVLDVFSGLGVHGISGRVDALALSSLSLLVTCLALTLIDRAGRKSLLLIGAALMGSCLLLLSMVHRMHWPPAVVVTLLAVYHASFGFSQGAVVWVYLSEIFPVSVRARGQSLGSTVLWIANVLVVDTFPSIARRLGDRIFFWMAILLALQFVIIYVFYPETKGKKLEAVAP
ncbi:MFS transporter [Silvibacterium acidisoli]|uniref:MFS transporter n=1 Tax=Acidobacteriaceae bacterium ZG23-2 TaxID=2883246 RepID=UPI00406CF842